MINFSPELIELLPQYLGINIQKFVKVTDFKYSKAYLYNAIKSYCIINNQLNTELNKAWDMLELNSDDLENIYSLSTLIKEGNSKLEQYQQHQQHTQQTHKKEG